MGPVNGITISVETLQDLMNGTPFEEMLHFGRTPTNHERKQWIEKHRGSEADNRRLIEFSRKRDDRDLQERPVTATQVQDFDTKGNKGRQTIPRWASDFLGTPIEQFNRLCIEEEIVKITISCFKERTVRAS